MQPIIVLALIGVAAAATSVGFLNTNIMLNVQNFGVGEETLETPISDANVDFSIGRMVTSDAAGRTIFMNIIDACSFHYPVEDLATYPGLASQSAKVICKLTDENGNVVAEGEILGPVVSSETVMISIDTLAYDGANKVEVIEDVIIVALGADPTVFEAALVPPNEAFTVFEDIIFEVPPRPSESGFLEGFFENPSIPAESFVVFESSFESFLVPESVAEAIP